MRHRPRIRHRDQGRELFQLYFDHFGCVARLVAGFGNNDRYVIADVTHPVCNKGRVGRFMHRDFVLADNLPATGKTADFICCPVRARQDLDDARRVFRLGRIYVLDFRVCNRRPENPSVSLTRTVYVIDVVSLSGQETLIFATFDRCSDCSVRHETSLVDQWAAGRFPALCRLTQSFPCARPGSL